MDILNGFVHQEDCQGRLVGDFFPTKWTMMKTKLVSCLENAAMGP
jgi:hypothetical protein